MIYSNNKYIKLCFVAFATIYDAGKVLNATQK